MLQYLIKTTNNSLSMVLMTALLLAVALRFPSPGASLRRRTYPAWALAAGLAAALVYAVLKRTTGFAVREYYDLGVLLPSIAASVFLLFFLWWAFADVKVRGAVFRLSAFCSLATWAAYGLPNVLLYPFEFAVGMDTIFNSEFMYRVIGYTLGLLVTFLTGLALYAVGRKLSPRVVLSALALGVLVTVAFQVLTVAQILLGRRMISRARWLMGPVMWGLTHVNFFMYALMGLALALAVILFVRVRTTPIVGENPALRRKMRAGARRQAYFGAGVSAGLLTLLLIVTVGQSYANRAVELSPPVELPVADGKIVIPIETVNDGNLHRYVHKASDGTEVRYIVIRKSDVAYGVGLDACDVCGASGYYQRKDQVICILCDVVMNISTIGFPGGCNPVPLKYRLTDGALLIETKDLEAEKRRFR
ncbi:MAG: Fe-S-containing protein [Synergistaceae bacterium]|jgi:uncharacterized membrane protein|nr:Fe-S-containing protein [Synergistaceae bacterium]